MDEPTPLHTLFDTALQSLKIADACLDEVYQFGNHYDLLPPDADAAFDLANAISDVAEEVKRFRRRLSA